MRTADFDYDLPPELIAQHPAIVRDASRMLVYHRSNSGMEHRLFRQFPDHLSDKDVLVLNNSRVVPARLHGTNALTRGQFEIFLVEENSPNDWWTLMRPGKRAKIGTKIQIKDKSGALTHISAVVTGTNSEGHRRISFEGTINIFDDLDRLGQVPLPPYIERKDLRNEAEDWERYQTCFASEKGSVAAPTAGLHFTEEVLDRIRAKGTRVCFVTLHVGLGTFAPVKAEVLSEHQMHEERFDLPRDTIEAIHSARQRGGRVVAVGTTSLRVLESVALQNDGGLVPGQGRTRLFVHPPWDFRIVDALLTNFHLPKSTLLMLVSAFASPGSLAGIDGMLAAYRAAIKERYRFFSYGDAMLIL